ncbi:hypothetical protein CANMA_000235 [Candida margitis]|uniref:uncharacterized protein n=1 Tax=Candida margitis TaxID=1775924 RepID=UPI0022277FC4|nr:uncharacterized protein CANMA_000235 [Candida margitis]KAI5970644.1 hypothetical protein CANMA_000235 [Candida margitis]
MQQRKYESLSDKDHQNQADSRTLKRLQNQARQDDEQLANYEGQVNNIFKIASVLQSGNDNSKQVAYELHDNLQDDTSKPSLTSVTALAIQLNKLKILDTKLRVDSIELAKKSAQKKVDNLKNNNEEIENQIDSIRLKILKKESEMITDYSHKSEELVAEIRDFEMTKITQVQRQSKKIQFQHFKILLEIALQRRDGKKLYFHHQPILKLEEFLGYNLLVINQFLERLVVLQNQLSILFNIQLPHSRVLTKYLPDSKFYDLLKRKESMVTGQQDSILDDDAIEQKESTPMDIENVTGKVIKLGDAYQLPLSSKTLNYQRRAARLTSPIEEPIELNSIPIIRQNSLSSSATRKITIPHRIINKPFNKLSIKDFLEFLVVIVRIIANFQVLLAILAIDTSDFNLEDWCNFEKLLDKLVSFDESKHRVELNSPISMRYNSKTNSHDLMQQVYKSIVKSTFAQKHHNKTLAFQNLNFNNLFLNESKTGHGDDWDLISEIL